MVNEPSEKPIDYSNYLDEVPTIVLLGEPIHCAVVSAPLVRIDAYALGDNVLHHWRRLHPHTLAYIPTTVIFSPGPRGPPKATFHFQTIVHPHSGESILGARFYSLAVEAFNAKVP